ALILVGRDDGAALLDVRVHLGTHPDLPRYVDARLDREGDAGNERPLLPRLEVVEMRAGAVQRARIDRVAGAVREVLAEAARFDHGARRVVDVTAAERVSGGDVVHHLGD